MVKRKIAEIDDDLVTSRPRKTPIFGDHQPLAQEPDSSLEIIEAELRRVMDDFVKVYERLDLSDDVTCKPNYSYTELVYLALLRSPNFCLPITEIYNYIKGRFSFFRQASSKSHWKNAVRHSLSKTKCFTKINVGRGNKYASGTNRALFLWCVMPSSIVSFARGDYRPSVDKESGTNTLRWGYYRVNAGQFWGQVAKYLQAKFDHFQYLISNSKNPQIIVSEQKCSVPDDVQRDLGSHLTSSIGSSNDSTSECQEPRLSPSLASLDLQEFSFSLNASADSGVGTADERSPSNRHALSSNDSGFVDTRVLLSNSTTSETADVSLISVATSPIYDSNRDSPDLPDLKHATSFELSPLTKYCDSPILDLKLSPLPQNENNQPSTLARFSPPFMHHGSDVTSTPYSYHNQYHQHFRGQSHVPLLHPMSLPYLQSSFDLRHGALEGSQGVVPGQSYHKISGLEQQPYHLHGPQYLPYPIQGHDVMLPSAFSNWN